MPCLLFTTRLHINHCFAAPAYTQTLLAVPLVGLYMGGAACVRALEARRAQNV